MPYQRTYNKDFGELGAGVARRWPEKDVIAAKNKKKKTLGLALSGGGYRSAIFNYGVLRGLYRLGLIGKFDYLSVVSGGSWIGTAFATTRNFKWFFRDTPAHPNFIEEGFESLLVNPIRVAQEAALSRKNANFVSNAYGRLLAKTFLRELGDQARFRPLSHKNLVRDNNRPFLIVNGTVNYRTPDTFKVTQECFEMTRLYCGSRELGYVSTSELNASELPLRVRDAVAISGAAVAVHIPAFGRETTGLGLSREIANFTRGQKAASDDAPTVEHLDVADGGHYNNLGVESLVNRGCSYIVLVDAEHDPESLDGTNSNQSYHGLKTLLSRNNVKNPMTEQWLDELDRADEAVHEFSVPDDDIPDILSLKLKSSRDFNSVAEDEPYNQPGFFGSLFGSSQFSFDPQFSTAKLDYDFAEHRNLSNLGAFLVNHHRNLIQAFVNKSE